ncbi:hypothetical protein IWZ00DRAFT_544593 [Phyllosticta capitalensis]
MADHHISGFVAEEWEVIQAPDGISKDGVQTLALSIAAQIPGGRHVTPSMLLGGDDVPTSAPGTESVTSFLVEKAADYNINLVFCKKETTSSTWEIVQYDADNNYPIVLVGLSSAGFEGMTRTTAKLDLAIDPLPFSGLQVTAAEIKRFDQVIAEATLPEDEEGVFGRRNAIKCVDSDADDYNDMAKDPQSANYTRRELTSLRPCWIHDVKAGVYRPLNAFAFHWFGWLSRIPEGQRKLVTRITAVDGVTRHMLWDLWDKALFESSTKHLSSDFGIPEIPPQWKSALDRMKTRGRMQSLSVPSLMQGCQYRSTLNPGFRLHASKLLQQYVALDSTVRHEYLQLLDASADSNTRVCVGALEVELSRNVISLDGLSRLFALDQDRTTKIWRLLEVRHADDGIHVTAHWHPHSPPDNVRDEQKEKTTAVICSASGILCSEKGHQHLVRSFIDKQITTSDIGSLPAQQEAGFTETLLVFILRAMIYDRVSPTAAIHPTPHRLCIGIRRVLERFSKVMTIELLAQQLNPLDEYIPSFLEEDSH